MINKRRVISACMSMAMSVMLVGQSLPTSALRVAAEPVNQTHAEEETSTEATTMEVTTEATT